jgi:hypothetical protein
MAFDKSHGDWSSRMSPLYAIFAKTLNETIRKNGRCTPLPLFLSANLNGRSYTYQRAICLLLTWLRVICNHANSNRKEFGKSEEQYQTCQSTFGIIIAGRLFSRLRRRLRPALYRKASTKHRPFTKDYSAVV